MKRKKICDLAIGEHVIGYRYDCEECRQACIGRKDARFCSTKCRLKARNIKRNAGS